MHLDQLKRREFITLLGGAAAAWPLAARAQQTDRKRRVGVLMNFAADDAEGQPRLTALVQGLQELGWTDGRNLRIDYRWGAADADRHRKYAAEPTSPTSIVSPSSEALATVTFAPAPASAAKRIAAISPSSLAAIAPIVLAFALSNSVSKRSARSRSRS
jgi:hypothetical protein